jgi:flagellar biosynthetic protein FliR
MPDTGDAARLAIGAVGRAFKLAVQISAPFIAFAFLFNLGLGILSRLMPQMQVFFLALPLTILIGVIVLMAALGMMMSVYLGQLGDFLNQLGFG